LPHSDPEGSSVPQPVVRPPEADRASSKAPTAATREVLKSGTFIVIPKEAPGVQRSGQDWSNYFRQVI
jgi:hypothetical protein